ncbi:MULTISPECIES: ABC transporter permease [Methylosinus]|uniref:ABC transporter permease n=1 Tax=Methylosinus trichosporium (strain ATCC 35070 / NCIMB 11131 / UNIQEM 75 / OB3b) TaxID=595536 RepID=A0A2D2CVN8_METT3|nr:MULTISPECIES: FtsX-like permease family protein [Methylosinus]ATQ66803.1 ABC transporter permease [Methylosinus trichosporium OB3b]OBS54179.1 glycosyl transferase family 1 [Methylosinus sp. 3S-1]
MKGSRLPLPLRFALRDLIGDLRGFSVFIACIVIGVAAIAGVGAASSSLSAGLAREGRAILGGDISLAVTSRPFTPEQRAFLERAGRVGEIALIRAMARSEAGEAALVEVKAVDAAFPLAGAVTLAPAQSLAEALGPRDGVLGVAADSTLIARLDLKVGDRLKIGSGVFDLRGELVSEPDKLAGGVAFGSRVLMSEAGLAASRLDRPGVILRRVARVALGAGDRVAEDRDVEQFATALAAAFPDAGWEMRRRDAVSPQFTRNQQRFTQLLTLVALTALVAGGAGVANAVDGFVARKRDSFAILKALGAPASRVFAIALTEVLLVAALAIAGGLALGSAFPFLLDRALGAVGLPFAPSVDLRSLAIGALCGLLVTLIFALGPLGRAYATPVARLLREETEETRTPRLFAAASLACVALLIGAILAFAADLRLAAAYAAATGTAFLLLRGVAALVVLAATRAPRFASLRLRHAIANIRRPRNLAAPLVLSIGLTQTLLVALALVEASIHAELAPRERGRTPNFFFIDVPKEQAAEFSAFLTSFSPDARIEQAPMLRGRIVAVKGARVETLKPPDDISWALDGDRGVTFSSTLPAGSTLAAGSWWRAEEDRPESPLVSLEARVAEGLGLAVGDEITVNALGRELTARVANLRRVDWRSFGINFMMVFSPAAFADAPYSQMVTAAFDGRDDGRDARLTREVAKRFPMIAALRVKDALDAVGEIADRLTTAARGAAAIAILTAALALGSAVAASQQTRLRDAVILSTLGATRGFLISAYGIEFALLGAAAGAVAVAAGSGAAAFILTTLMRMDFVFRPGPVAATMLGALVFAIALGLAGSWRALGRRPGAALRRR